VVGTLVDDRGVGTATAIHDGVESGKVIPCGAGVVRGGNGEGTACGNDDDACVTGVDASCCSAASNAAEPAATAAVRVSVDDTALDARCDVDRDGDAVVCVGSVSVCRAGATAGGAGGGIGAGIDVSSGEAVDRVERSGSARSACRSATGMSGAGRSTDRIGGLAGTGTRTDAAGVDGAFGSEVDDVDDVDDVDNVDAAIRLRGGGLSRSIVGTRCGATGGSGIVCGATSTPCST
jgi:hypothetical protein